MFYRMIDVLQATTTPPELPSEAAPPVPYDDDEDEPTIPKEPLTPLVPLTTERAYELAVQAIEHRQYDSAKAFLQYYHAQSQRFPL